MLSMAGDGLAVEPGVDVVGPVADVAPDLQIRRSEILVPPVGEGAGRDAEAVGDLVGP